MELRNYAITQLQLQTPDFAWKFVWTVPTNYTNKCCNYVLTKWSVEVDTGRKDTDHSHHAPNLCLVYGVAKKRTWSNCDVELAVVD